MRARPFPPAPVRWAAALLLAGLAAWLSIRQVRWSELAQVLAAAQPALLFLALLSVLLTTGLKAARWAVLLRPCHPPASPARVLRVLIIGQMFNNFYSRLGDVLRAVLLGPGSLGGVPAVLGTLLVEKALDGLVGLALLAGLVVWAPLPGWLRVPMLGLALLTGGLLALLAWASVPRSRQIRPLRRLLEWLPAPVERMVAGLALGLGLFRAPGQAALALGLTAAVWLMSVSTNFLTLAALGIEAPAWASWLVLVTGYVATFLPTVPAQVGVFEYAAVLSLTAAGVPAAEQALAFGLVLHLLVHAPPALLGPLAMAREGLTWQGLRAAGLNVEPAGAHD